MQLGLLSLAEIWAIDWNFEIRVLRVLRGCIEGSGISADRRGSVEEASAPPFAARAVGGISSPAIFCAARARPSSFAHRSRCVVMS